MFNSSITVGMIGLNFCSGNLGCGALAYSFRSLLIEACRSLNMDLKIIVFSNVGCETYSYINQEGISETIVHFSFKRPKSIQELPDKLLCCDVVFDFTEGDSFTDIYGIKRFATTSILKLMAIKYSGALVLGPQTHGPFRSPVVRAVAKNIIRSSRFVYARDRQSAELIEQLGRDDVFLTTDVAFSLGYELAPPPCQTQKKLAGLNVSGLLWNGGYSGDNQFGLKVNYRNYTAAIINMLINMGYEVCFIPHVIDRNSSRDSDSYICSELARRYGGQLAPDFATPMDAKSYIARMDVFIGARMHAAIGAFSSGVPTIPFSYSRKFEGLFGSLGYNYCIDGRALSTDQAIALTSEYLNSLSDLTSMQQSALDTAKNNIAGFKASLVDLMSSISANERRK